MKNSTTVFGAMILIAGGCLVPSLFILNPVFADTLVLKNGKEIKGLVVERHADRIILSTERGEMPILVKGIKEIKYDDAEQNFYQMAKAYEKENRLGEALAYYEKAIEINPDFEEAKKAALGVRNRFWAASSQGPTSEIEKKQTLYDAWGQGKAPEAVIEKQSEEESRRLREGLGISLEKKGDWVRVSAVYSNKPALAAGLKNHDRLVAIDGESLRYLAPAVVTKKLLEPRFTNFNLQIQRNYPLMHAESESVQALGFELNLGYDGLTIKSVAPESTASQAGLRQDDLVSEIDGKPTRYMPIHKALAMIKKSKRATVVITIRRSLLLAMR
jgi:C-terminal processing protease CtpA/Prc